MQIAKEIKPDDWIDPQLFLKWKANLPKAEKRKIAELKFSAKLTETNGAKGTYNVLPMHNNGTVTWLDPAGYELAKSEVEDWDERYSQQRSDFKLIITKRVAFVERVYL